MIEKSMPCNPFDKIFVSKPRNIKPEIPLSLITLCTHCG